MTARNSRQGIREAIRASGKTQEDTAAAIGVSPITLSRWLNGHADPAFDKLDQLAAAIGQPITLVFGKQQKEPPPEWARDLPGEVAAAVIERLAEIPEIAQAAAVELGLAAPRPDESRTEADEAPRDTGRTVLPPPGKRV